MSKGNDGRVTLNVKKCVVEMLSVVLENVRDDAHDIVVDLILDYLLKSNKSKLMEKLCERKMVPRVLDEYDCAAQLDESCPKIWQWRKTQQCLKLFMDILKVGVAEKHLRALGVYHGEIKHETYYYTDLFNPSKVKEEVRYWTKDPVYEFIQTIEGLINGYSLSPLEIDFAVTAAVVKLIRLLSQSRRRRHLYAHPIASSKSRESSLPCMIPPWPFSFPPPPDLNA